MPRTKQVTKQRRPNRQKLKKQITVRIDEDLLKAALVRAESQDLRLTDAIEDGLWLWLQSPPKVHILRGRFLWNVIPLKLQRLTYGFWGYFLDSGLSATEQILRNYLETTFWSFYESPKCMQNLEQLGGSPEDGAAVEQSQ